MAFVVGFVNLPVDTYANWKNAVAGNGYDADGYYGDQCWDLAAEFWYNVGFPTSPLYPKTGPNGYASECWTVSRYDNIDYNGTTYFDLVVNVEDVRQGDVVVFPGAPGHIGFADEDYDITKAGYIAILGQNQGSGGVPPAVSNPNGGTTANVKDLWVGTPSNPTGFLGAFRYKFWNPTPPPPSPTEKKHRFPWVLYDRKLRENRQFQ